MQAPALLALGLPRMQVRVQADAALRGERGEGLHEARLVVGDVRRPEIQPQHRIRRGVVPVLEVRAALLQPGLLGVEHAGQSRAHQVLAQAQLAHGADLGGEARLAAVAQEERMVGAGGAARKQELRSRHPRRGGDVAGVHPRPHRVEAGEPVLRRGAVQARPRPRDVLEEVMVQAHQARDQQAAGEVDARVDAHRDGFLLHAFDARACNEHVRVLEQRASGMNPACVSQRNAHMRGILNFPVSAVQRMKP